MKPMKGLGHALMAIGIVTTATSLSFAVEKNGKTVNLDKIRFKKISATTNCKTTNHSRATSEGGSSGVGSGGDGVRAEGTRAEGTRTKRGVPSYKVGSSQIGCKCSIYR